MDNQSVSDLFTKCFERDEYSCRDCGSKENLEIHHIKPISQGGRNHLDNLLTVCGSCHDSNYRDVHYPKDKSIIVPYGQREKTRYGIDKNRFTQVLLSLPKELLYEIEEYRHDNRFKNRNEAIRELVMKGLATKEGGEGV